MTGATRRGPVPSASAAGRRAPGWPLAVFRSVVAVHVLLVLAQAAFAGRFLGGDSAALALHERNGTEIITVVALAQIVAAVLLWRPGRGSVLPAAVSAGLFAAEVLQIGYGFTGRLALHVPLGVAILGTAVALLVGTRAPGARPESAAPSAYAVSATRSAGGAKGTDAAVAVAGVIAGGLAGGLLLDRGPGIEPLALVMAVLGGVLAVVLRARFGTTARERPGS